MGQNLTKTSDSLCPLTADNVEGFKSDDDLAAEEAPAEEKVPAEAAPVASVQGAVTTIKHGKVVISIKKEKIFILNFLSNLKRTYESIRIAKGRYHYTDICPF